MPILNARVIDGQMVRAAGDGDVSSSLAFLGLILEGGLEQGLTGDTELEEGGAWTRMCGTVVCLQCLDRLLILLSGLVAS